MKSKNIFTVLIFVFFSSFCSSQEQVQVFATYDFKNTNTGKTQLVELRVNEKAAYSEFFESKKLADTLYADEFENVFFEKESKDSIGQQYYLSNNELVFRDHIYTNNEFVAVVVTEGLPKMDWILKKGTILMNGFTCNVASLDFRGRVYNVWYTNEVPTKFGPWKFHGLSGLIVKIETEDKSVKFQLTSIVFEQNQKLGMPTLGKKITFQEFVQYEEKITSDFVEKLKTKLPRGTTIQVNDTESTNIEKNYK